jgi:type 2 lantibiotic (TIGR03893 family)
MSNINFGIDNPVGPAFEDLSIEEMVTLQGSGDVHADSAQSSAACEASIEVATETSPASIIAASLTFIGTVASAYSVKHHCF